MTTRAFSTLDEKNKNQKARTRKQDVWSPSAIRPLVVRKYYCLNWRGKKTKSSYLRMSKFHRNQQKIINILGSLMMTQNASPRWQHNTTTQLCSRVTSFSLYKIFTGHRSTKTTTVQRKSKLAVKPSMFWTSLVQHSCIFVTIWTF